MSLVAIGGIGSSEPGTLRNARERPYVLSGNDIRSDVRQRVIDSVLTGSAGAEATHLYEVVTETLYAEKQRLADAEPDPRTSEDREFVSRMRRTLVTGGPLPKLICEIVDHYTREIAGHFDPLVYRLATRVVPAGLSVCCTGSPFNPPKRSTSKIAS